MQTPLERLFSLEGKVAVVLGGTSGIGLAITRGFVLAGAAAVVASSREQAKVDAAAAEIERAGAATLRLASDVQSRPAMEALAEAAMSRFGHIDILVVTSGALHKTPSLELTDEEFGRIVDINLNGTFRANQIFGRHMVARGSGSIINTCSLTTFVTFHEVTAYAASKAGVGMLTKQLAAEWARHHVRVNAIAPGVFRTPLNSRALDIPERSAAILQRTPMGRVGQVDELMGAAIYLASDASSFVTGQILAVDGGFLAKGI